MFVASSSSPGPSRHIATDESLTSPLPSTPLAAEEDAPVVPFIEHPSDSGLPDSEAAVDNAGPEPFSAGILEECLPASVSPGSLPITHRSSGDIRPAQSVDRGNEPSIAVSQPPRTMKSLGSLLDDFREIARSATQISLKSSRTQGTRPRPRARPRTAQAILQPSGQLAHAHTLASARTVSPARPTTGARRPRDAYMRAASLALPSPSLSLRRLQDRVSCAGTGVLGPKESLLAVAPEKIELLNPTPTGAYMSWMSRSVSPKLSC